MKENPKIINPLLVFFGGWFLWWVIFISSPFQTNVDYYFKHDALDYMVSSYAFFIVGVMLGMFFSKEKSLSMNKFKPINVEALKIPLFIMLVVCFLGDFLQTVDYVIKGSGGRSLAATVSQFREVDSIFPAPIAYFSLLTMKVSVLPIFVVLLGGERIRISNPGLFYASLLVALYPLVNLLVFGKRGFMIITLAMYTWYFIYFRLWRERKLVLRAISLVMILFSISYVSFNARYGEGKYNVLEGIQATYSYAATVLPTNDAIAGIEQDIAHRNGFAANVKIALINFAQYYTHGTFEFFHLYDYNYGRGSPRTNGSQTLSLPYKILDFIGIIDFSDYTFDAYLIDDKAWIFDSFLGGQLKDWGDNAIYSMLIMGLFFGGVYRLVQSSQFLFPVYAMMSTMVFLMPVVDVFTSGQAWHYIVLNLLGFVYMSKVSKVNS